MTVESPQSNGGTSVRVYAEDHPALARALRNRLRKAKQQVLDDLIYAGDWADFKRRVGVIAGLTEAIETCNDAEKEFNGG